MRKHCLLSLLFSRPFRVLVFIWFLASSSASACGYNWISECSSEVHLRINGTLDSFQIAPCPYGYSFDGLYLGNLQSISLANARAVTWESCQNNVSGIQLWYRVYEQGAPGGSWNILDMQQDHFKVEGAYTTRFRSLPAETPLNNLIAGKTYTLEVYFVAQIDTIGDDFIPETTLLRNNNGLNYKLGFTYGGAAAPPLLFLPHLTLPTCNGAGNGKISVAVYGDHNGIFYHWSDHDINFYELNNVPAGDYSLTVTNAAGDTVSTTIQLTQPPPLQISFVDIQSIGCNNSPGSATAQPAGGTPPWQFHWSTGQDSARADFNTPGVWTVTVTDAHGCSTSSSVTIENNGLVERNINASICSGASYVVGNQSFTTSGNFDISLPGNGACDTLVHLGLTVQNPAALLQHLPSSVVLTCASPTLNLCADTAQNTVYQWSRGGLILGNNPCLLLDTAGVYQVQCTQGNCSAAQTIPVTAHLSPLPDTIVGHLTLNCLAPAPVWLVCHTPAQHAVFSWVQDSTLLSSADSCLFTITDFENGMPVFPALTVTDSFGCRNTNPVQAISITQDTLSPVFSLAISNASNAQADNGMVIITGLADANACDIQWETGDTTLTINQLTPGDYCVTVTGGNGCTASDCGEVVLQLSAGEPERATMQIVPNPVMAGSNLLITLLPDIPGNRLYWHIRSVTGRQVAAGKLDYGGNGQFFIPVPGTLAPGSYMVQVGNNAMTLQAKVFVFRD